MTPPLTNTSATAQVAPLRAVKAISCKRAVRHRRLQLAQVQRRRRRLQQQQRLQRRPRQLLRQRQLRPPRRQLPPRPPLRLLVLQRLLRAQELLHQRGRVRLHGLDPKAYRSAITDHSVVWELASEPREFPVLWPCCSRLITARATPSLGVFSYHAIRDQFVIGG